jgi:bacillithiol biosynthesis deacetylase BshB1
MKVDILAIGVHPDDIELCASGTLLRHLDMGFSIGLCDLTRGELGTRGNGDLRLKEAEAARKIFGEDVQRVNLGMADGFFVHNEEHIISIAKVVRQFQPEIVLCNAISDRHPDHGRASKLISDACFFAGLVKITTSNEDGSIQSAWRPKTVYHYIQDRNLKADFVVDISNYMDKKIETIMAYSSQFFNPDSDEPSTPISGLDFIEFIKAKNRTYARDIGAEYAEGFTVERIIGVNNLFDLK